MFLSFLNENEKKAFLGLAHKVALADNVLHDQEKRMMELYEYECGIPLGDEKHTDITTLCSAFTSKANQVYCMIELLGLALSDSDFPVSEQNVINEIASRLNINSETSKYLSDWINRQNSLTAEITNYILKLS